MRIIMGLVLMWMVCAPIAWAGEAGDVRKLAKKNIDLVIEILKDSGIDKEGKKKRILAVVNPLFDFNRMAKLSLGKKHWVQMNKAQRKEFSDLFVIRLRESYLDKLDLYTDEEVTVEEAKQVKKRIHVQTHLVTKDDRKEMVYKFYRSKQGWKVYDVVILGVSVVQTYRSQFSGLLRKGSIEDLLTRLRSKGSIAIPTVEKKS